MRRRLFAGIRAGAMAGVLSGVPSTVHALATGRSPFESVYAAGTLLAPDDAPRPRLAVSGLVAHGAISFGWGAVLGLLLPRRAPVLWGAAAGLAIATLDLRLVARRYQRIDALPRCAQVADHVAYGAIVGLVLSTSRSWPSGPGRSLPVAVASSGFAATVGKAAVAAGPASSGARYLRRFPRLSRSTRAAR